MHGFGVKLRSDLKRYDLLNGVAKTPREAVMKERVPAIAGASGGSRIALTYPVCCCRGTSRPLET